MRSHILAPATLVIPTNPIAGRPNDEEFLTSDGAWESFLAKGVQPYAKGVGFRAHIDEDMKYEGQQVGSGYYDFVKVTDGLYARVFDADVYIPMGSRTPGDDWLKIDLYISGRQSVVFDGLGQADLDQTWCTVHRHPEGIDKGEWNPGGSHASGIVLYVHRTFLAKHLGEDAPELPKLLSQFAGGEGDRFLFERLPVSMGMARAINEIMSVPYMGALRRLFMEARCLDILTAILAALNGDPDEGPPQLNSRDRNRIHEAKQIVEERFADPPGIVELARRVGLNQQKLKVGFKQIVGSTISAYCQELRLSEAWRMLRATDLSITQVAFEVGYEFPTNFATAFKRRYGVSPYRFRKGGPSPA
jgi:AraC-like DNA-binding protein